MKKPLPPSALNKRWKNLWNIIGESAPETLSEDTTENRYIKILPLMAKILNDEINDIHKRPSKKEQEESIRKISSI